VTAALPRDNLHNNVTAAPPSATATMELIMISARTAPTGAATSRSPTLNYQEQAAGSAQQMSDLLRRYPEVNDAERLELVNFLKRGHPEAIVLATYGADLVPQVRKVKKDHPEHFPSGRRMLLPWLGFLTVVLLMLLLARLL
jgi:hypothetical protein